MRLLLRLTAAALMAVTPATSAAQFIGDTPIERDGVRFLVRPAASVSANSQGSVQVTLTEIIARVDRSAGVTVDGENYAATAFGGQLSSFFDALEVQTLDLRLMFDGMQGCRGEASGAAWRPGSGTSVICNAGGQPRLTGYRISGISTSGVFDLHREVRRLRNEARQAAAAAARPAASPSPTNTRPSNGSSPSSASSPSGSPSGSTRPAGSGGTTPSSGDRPGGARPMDGPDNSGSRPATPPSPPQRDPGQEALNKLARDIQESTRRRDSLANAFTNQLASIAAQRAADEEAAEEERERRRREAEAAEEARVARVEGSRRQYIARLERDRNSAVASIQALTGSRQRLLSEVERAKAYRERPTERWAFIVATQQWAPTRWPASVDESAFSYNDDSGHESAYRSRANSYAGAANGIAIETIIVSRPFLVRPDAEGFYPLTAPMIAKFQRQNAGYVNVEVLGWYSREQAEALYARTAERVQQCSCRVTLTRTVFVP